MSTFTNFIAVVVLLLVCTTAHAQLSATFYATRCPTLRNIVRTSMTRAVAADRRMGASILRVFFHDCFVQGCDGSVLLDDTATLTGEKTALPNRSLRGFEVIDSIKTSVEAACPGVVSCADILALAARDGVFLLGGRTWTVPLGRRDARTASLSGALGDLPSPLADLPTLTALFSRKGFNPRELTALSGSHSIGQAQCATFRNRIYEDTNIDPNFATLRQSTCPLTGGNTNLAPLDATPVSFDNRYYQDLVNRRGLLRSDQVLFNNGTQDSLVRAYSISSPLFLSDFAAAMVKMGNMSPLTGVNGEIRLNCRRLN